MYCILCLCIILLDTSKASENLTFILKRFCVCVIICCLGAMKIEGVNRPLAHRGNELRSYCSAPQIGCILTDVQGVIEEMSQIYFQILTY